MRRISNIQLPAGTYWDDQFTYSAVVWNEQKTLSGTVVYQGIKTQGGRKITLNLPRDAAWLSYADLLALNAILNRVATVEFEWDSVIYVVILESLKLQPLIGYSTPQDDKFWGSIELKTVN